VERKSVDLSTVDVEHVALENCIGKRIDGNVIKAAGNRNGLRRAIGTIGMRASFASVWDEEITDALVPDECEPLVVDDAAVFPPHAT